MTERIYEHTYYKPLVRDMKTRNGVLNTFSSVGWNVYAVTSNWYGWPTFYLRRDITEEANKLP